MSARWIQGWRCNCIRVFRKSRQIQFRSRLDAPRNLRQRRCVVVAIEVGHAKLGFKEVPAELDRICDAALNTQAAGRLSCDGCDGSVRFASLTDDPTLCCLAVDQLSI